LYIAQVFSEKNLRAPIANEPIAQEALGLQRLLDSKVPIAYHQNSKRESANL